jgi:UrcA family protein
MSLNRAFLMLAAVASSATIAHAQPVNVMTDADGNSQATVETADLDLSNDSGAHTMWYRIREAAADVCGPEPSQRDLGQTVAYRDCMKKAEAGAVDRLGSTRVAQLSGLQPQLLASR